MTTIHIMLDLETWGTTPGSDIRSIGACVFDPERGEIALAFGDGSTPDANITSNSFYIACDNPHIHDAERYSKTRKYPLTRDPRTVQWWSEQSAEAQAAFEGPVDLKSALLCFAQWLCNFYPDGVFDVKRDANAIRIWSHGAAFDPPILAAAYAALGLPVPWHYRAPRDTRTLFDIAGITDHSAWLNARPGPLGIPHHALDDAICQARGVCAAYKRINLWRLIADSMGQYTGPLYPDDHK